MSNQQKLKKLFARLDEIEAYGRSIGKLSFDMSCCAPEEGMGAAQVTTGADLINLESAGDDNNIVFNAPGTYTVSIDTATGEITIVAG